MGAVRSLDITRDSKYLITGSADASIKVWEVMTGKCLLHIAMPGPVSSVAFAEGDRQFVTCHDNFGRDIDAAIHIYNFNKEDPSSSSTKPAIPPIINPDCPREKITRVDWLPLNDGVLASLENGQLRTYDPKSGKIKNQYSGHTDKITSFSFNDKKTLLVTASRDRTAKLWDVKEMKVLRSYQADVPLNGASISPIREHVIAGGGQEAMNVTTTQASAGKFETRFYHMIFEKELGRVRGHFGPINTLAFHPDGQSFTSGAEDGYLRMHRLDSDYFALGDEDNLDDPVLTAALKEGVMEQLEQEEAEEAAKEAELAKTKASASSSNAANK